METFKCGRDFAAWLGLVPRQKSSGGIGTSVPRGRGARHIALAPLFAPSLGGTRIA
ncbi:MAG: hypothetical protein EOR73_26830 [Mesorhizobium sp.]|nr:MAG: hypothetical protein EOR73_26830 [Mesorhizobium sp.]